MHHRQSSKYKNYLLGLFESEVWSPEKLFDILSRRGFLVKFIDNKIFLSAGHIKSDYEYLERYASQRPFLIKTNEPSFPFQLDFNSFDKVKVLSMFTDAPCEAEPFFKYETRGDSFQSFVNNRYGRKVPLEQLDIGVASFVKTLPLVSVVTSYSCDGHDKEAPSIEFNCKINMEWHRYLELFFLRPNDLFSKSYFVYTNGKFRNGGVEIHATESYLDTFNELYEASQFMRKPESRKAILLLKEQFIDLWAKGGVEAVYQAEAKKNWMSSKLIVHDSVGTYSKK
jgi:hypothetical protein